MPDEEMIAMRAWHFEKYGYMTDDETIKRDWNTAKGEE